MWSLQRPLLQVEHCRRHRCHLLSSFSSSFAVFSFFSCHLSLQRHQKWMTLLQLNA